ncbi:hypothetical protein [Puniceicoccus vermicola]|uniref:Uncharacterized protein n=1 Tax=Puniceicoccus vermicola TaxID=388746 RepID=A0A7X1E5T0_9BACT|nr:hypothetical protein [Puniceicoccus vermicola]MBC2601927.1 hypothetical protein [Puniceicoccus vermicola]
MRESDRGLEVTDNDLEEFYRSRFPVFEKVQILDEEEGIDYVIYYKVSGDLVPSSNRLWKEDSKGRRSDRPEQNPPGWMLHVVYYNGTSVLELYNRSKSLTELEKDGILLRNAEGKRWVKGRIPTDDDSVIAPEVFPANHYREDMGVYANVEGDSVLIYDPRLDQRINELNLERAKEEAPDSLDGF